IGIKQPIESMIAEFQKQDADAIGMSGLLVKSTVVMKEDLITLNERHLAMPVILGGAALNRRYVEQDLRAIYKGQLFYGEDAFDGLRIMDQLAARKKIASVGSVALKGIMNPPVSREAKPSVPAVSAPLRVAAKRDFSPRSPHLPSAPDRPVPPFLGSRIRTDFDMNEVFAFLNELTLFSTQWQFRKGGVKRDLYEKQIRETARPALERLKKLCLDENILRPAVAYGFFPAASDGTKLTIFREDHRTPHVEFHYPRQDHGDYLCLSDYIEPTRDGLAIDYVAFMAVTMGREVTKIAHEWYTAGKFQDYLYLHGLGVESAEALAEYFHTRIRQEWGIGGDDATDIRKLFKGHFRGCRYSFGYPACPNLEDQKQLFELIEPQRIGLELSEQFQLEPEQSTTAIVFHHPDAKYFNVTRQAECAV
ncbi:MAG TPA: vitamin B12 dependent-methionine synthase activation domain-containing protein, partial [Urbifossiella sp.]